MHQIISFILGVIQGLTEFIPISSSGHLVIAQHFFNSIDHKFLEFINIGTLGALLVYYWADLRVIARDIVKNKNYRLLRNIILTSIPAGLAGLLFADMIDSNPFFTNIWVVVVTLAVVGVLMIVLERLPKAAPVADGSKLPWQRALAIGVAQMFALVPGVSRSGSTIIASRLSGLSTDKAADYSFLASIPIMLAVTAKLFVHAEDRAYFVANMPGMIIGNLAAFAVGLLAIGFLLKYLRKHSLQLFGWYRVALAAVVALVLLVRP